MAEEYQKGQHGLTPLVPLAYAEWKRYGRHLKEYGSEFGGTAYLMFCIIASVALMSAPASPVPRLLPWPGLRLFCTGTLIGASAWLLAISPPGRLSGAHTNPAVSIGFWLLGKMHHGDLCGYVTAQMTGAVLGAWAARACLGVWARQIHWADLRPSKDVSLAEAFAAELIATCVLTSILYALVSHHRLLRLTPAFMTPVTGILVCAAGSISGAGMNPARWFGPAELVKDWSFPVLYGLGPLAGVVCAAALRHSGLLLPKVPLTGKLFHDPSYRSLFRYDQVPSRIVTDADRSRGS